MNLGPACDRRRKNAAMTVLVTGAGGFFGRWLLDALRRRNVRIVACFHHRSQAPVSAVGVEYARGDITDRAWVAKVLDRYRPDRIVHLAARSLVGPSWENPRDTCRVNVLGTVNLLEELRNIGFGGRLLLACSSAEYAAPDPPRPLLESDRLWPASIYGMSKLLADQMAQIYGSRYGLDILRVRPFFLIGPGKRGDVASDFAQGIVSIERGLSRRLLVGNLHPVRDFLDVRDGVEGLVTCLDRGVSGQVYNICSGRGVPVQELLGEFIAQARSPVEVVGDPSRVRSHDEPYKVGDPSRIRSLGWSPHYTLEQSVAAILEYWRAQPVDQLREQG